MYQPGSKEFEHHRQALGDQASFGYKDFIPIFTAAKFDPDAWVQLFRQAGAQFVVPTAEHHDGFPLYDSAFTRWNAAHMGPRRDLIAVFELSCANRALCTGFPASALSTGGS